jgi:hypothetical protein
MLAPRRFDRVTRAPVLHPHLRSDHAVVINGLEDFDSAETVEGDRVIGRDDEAHGAARAGAELGVLADLHADGGGLPVVHVAGDVDLHEPFNAGDGGDEFFLSAGRCGGRGGDNRGGGYRRDVGRLRLLHRPRGGEGSDGG